MPAHLCQDVDQDSRPPWTVCLSPQKLALYELIKIFCGRCGGREAEWRASATSTHERQHPCTLAKEHARRTVVDVGDDVRGLRVGDRVALEPGVPCWANPASRCTLAGHGPAVHLLLADLGPCICDGEWQVPHAVLTAPMSHSVMACMVCFSKES